MRALGARAKEWEHPTYGLFRMSEDKNKADGNILRVTKRTREIYAFSIMAMAMQDNYKQDWWINTSETEDSDGVIMTFSQESSKGLAREVQVVEHRSADKEIYDTLLDKIQETAYSPETILVCLVLINQLCDFQKLSDRLRQTPSTFDEIFLVFAGVGITESEITTESLKRTFSLVQVSPALVSHSFDYKILLDDFNTKFKLGRESRCITEDKIFFTTRNKSIPLDGEILIKD